MDLLETRHGISDREWSPGRCIHALAIFVLLLGSASAQTAGEYEVKAAFLYKFASFVEWPQGRPENQLCIGVVGNDPFGSDLERIVEGKTANGRAFRVRRFKALQDVNTCEIVFVSSSERARLQPILDRLKGMPVLTVGDVPEFCEDGGIIGLSLAGDRVRLQINLEAAERSNLQISSRLLKLASVVRVGAGGSR